MGFHKSMTYLLNYLNHLCMKKISSLWARFTTLFLLCFFSVLTFAQDKGVDVDINLMLIICKSGLVNINLYIDGIKSNTYPILVTISK